MPIYVDMEMGVDEWGFYTPESLNTFDSHRRMIVDVGEWNWVPLWESIFADVAKKEELDEKAKAFCAFFPLFLGWVGKMESLMYSSGWYGIVFGVRNWN